MGVLGFLQHGMRCSHFQRGLWEVSVTELAPNVC